MLWMYQKKQVQKFWVLQEEMEDIQQKSQMPALLSPHKVQIQSHHTTWQAVVWHMLVTDKNNGYVK